MRETLSVPGLPPGLNERGENLVIGAVARHPQEWQGPSALIADAALQEFGTEASRRSGIGLVELTRITPNGKRAAGRINAIHESFGVPYRVTPQQAYDAVRLGVATGMSEVGRVIYEAGQELALPIADCLEAIYVQDPAIKGLELYVRTQRLHSLLTRNSVLRGIVLKVVGESAAVVRASTRERQAYAQTLIGRAHIV